MWNLEKHDEMQEISRNNVQYIYCMYVRIVVRTEPSIRCSITMQVSAGRKEEKKAVSRVDAIPELEELAVCHLKLC